MDWRTETSMMNRSGNSGRRVDDELRVKATFSLKVFQRLLATVHFLTSGISLESNRTLGLKKIEFVSTHSS